MTELATGPDADHKLAKELFVRVDLKFYAKFAVGYRGKRKILSLAGGVLTLGNASPPVPLYDGPTDRPSVQKRLALGESVSHVPGFVAPGSSAPDPDGVSSANPKSVTGRCSRRHPTSSTE